MGYSEVMTMGIDMAEVKVRAARIRKTALTVLLLNLLTFPLTSFVSGALDLSFGNISPEQEAFKWAMLIAFLSAAHICRGYELELGERARVDPDVSRTAARVQFSLRLVGWTVVSLFSVVGVVVVAMVTRAIFGF